MSATIYRVEYDIIPPSANKAPSRGRHWSAPRNHKAEWEGIFAVLLMKGKVPRKLGRVHATARLEFKGTRKRDLDNYFFSVSKPFADAMVKGGWIEDDDPEHFKLEMSLSIGHKANRMILDILVPDDDTPL